MMAGQNGVLQLAWVFFLQGAVGRTGRCLIQLLFHNPISFLLNAFNCVHYNNSLILLTPLCKNLQFVYGQYGARKGVWWYFGELRQDTRIIYQDFNFGWQLSWKFGVSVWIWVKIRTFFIDVYSLNGGRNDVWRFFERCQGLEKTISGDFKFCQVLYLWVFPKG